MTRSKTKIKSKNSGNLTFLELKHNRKLQSSKHIANYYKDIDGVILPAESTLVNILVQQVETYGLIYAIQVLEHEVGESDNEEMYRFYQTSKKLFDKPEEEDWKYKDNIYLSFEDGGGSNEIPIEFLVDAAVQDKIWHRQADRTILLTNTALLQNDNTRALVPRALETRELELLHELAQKALKQSFKESTAVNGTATNANKWLSESSPEVLTEGEIEWEFNKDLSRLTTLIKIDPDEGMTKRQIFELLDETETQLLEEIRSEVWKYLMDVDLSFVIPTSQTNVVEGSEKYESIKKYLRSMDFKLDHESIEHQDRSADQDQQEYLVRVKDLELVTLLVKSGVTKPWKKKVPSSDKVDKVLRSNAAQVAANLKVVQKQDDDKEKYAEILEACIRHLKQNGVLLDVVPSTTMTNVNGTEVYGLQKERLIRAGKMFGKKGLHCLIKHLSGQIFIWDIWARVMAKLLISNNPDLQSMGLKYFDSMFTNAGVTRVSEKYNINSLLTKVVFGHSFGNLAMAVIWELVGEKEETVTKISLITQLTHEDLLDEVTENGEIKYFFRSDFETWILDVGKLIIASGSVIDLTDLIKIMFGCHPLTYHGSDLEEYPMNHWENMTGEVLLEEDGLEVLKTDIKTNDAWKSVRGRSHVKVSEICRILRRRNKELEITRELADAIMTLFQTAYEEKREEWNSSPNDGYIKNQNVKTESQESKITDVDEDISAESALSVVVRANNAHITDQLRRHKISQVQRMGSDMGSDLCTTHSLTDSCYYGTNCRNRHVSTLDPEDGLTLTEAIKKTLSASNTPGLNITFKGGTPANDKITSFNSENPGVRKKFMKNHKKRVNLSKTTPLGKAVEQDTNKSVTWAANVKNNTTSGKDFRKTRSKDKVDKDQTYGKGKGGRGSYNHTQNSGKGGYKGYSDKNDYYGKGNGSSNGNFNRGKGGRGKGGQGYLGRTAQPNTNRGQNWKTGDISNDGESVFLGTNQNQKLAFITKPAYENLENSIYDTMHRMYIDMVNFQSVAGFATFFEKCPHGCIFHTLHSKTCICANQHQSNCGVWPCVVNVFLPRMTLKERVGLNSLGRQINMNTKNSGVTAGKEHSPWRAHMSKRQIMNDRLLNEEVTEDAEEDTTDNNGTMIPYKSIQEVEMEEEETIKRLNLLKATKNKMKLSSRMKSKGSTRFVRVQGP